MAAGMGVYGDTANDAANQTHQRRPVYSSWSYGMIERLVRMVALERYFADLDARPEQILKTTLDVNKLVHSAPMRTPAEAMIGWPLRAETLPDTTPHPLWAAVLSCRDQRSSRRQCKWAEQADAAQGGRRPRPNGPASHYNEGFAVGKWRDHLLPWKVCPREPK